MDRWFNTDAGFNRIAAHQLASNVRVSPLRFGNLRADGQSFYHMSLIKSFQVIERVSLQVRAEALNALNHPNLNAPITNPLLATFGLITGQDHPRTWQMSLRLKF